MKMRTALFLVFVSLLPFLAFVGQWLFLVYVIHAGWGQEFSNWTQPDWLAGLQLSNDTVWVLPIWGARMVGAVGVGLIIAAIVTRSPVFGIAGSWCVLAYPLLSLHYIIASF